MGRSKRSFLQFLCFSLGLIAVKAFSQQSQFGRYVGVLKHEMLDREQLAKLDFIVSKSRGSEMDLKAVLTLHFGDFRSGEYVSYHFDKVNYNLLTGALVFDSAKEDVTVVSSRFSNGELRANFRSATGGLVGELDLKLNGIASPSRGLIEPLNGEYRGMCGAEDTVLQIHTMRSTEDSSRVGSPFSANEIRGQIGIVNTSMCGDRYPGRACSRDSFHKGAYDFYKGELSLVGELTNLQCRVSGDALKCGDACTLIRQSSEVRSRVFALPQVVGAFLNGKAPDNSSRGSPSIAGLYRGFVHNEYLDSYQPIEVDLSTYRVTDGAESVLKVSAVATLLFGSKENRQSLSYRFEPREFPNPILRQPFVLSRLEDDVDAILKVSELQKGFIQGEWFSLLFGRVGAFVASKDTTVEIPPTAKMLSALGGAYRSDDFTLDLKIFQGSAPPNTENPFYPLQLGGTMWFTGSAKQQIRGGSYDFYMGRLSVLYGEDRLLNSTKNQNGDLSAIMTSNGFGTLMPVYQEPRVFRAQE